MSEPNADHAIVAATWNAPDPWPICADCRGRVYLADDGWHHMGRQATRSVTKS